MFTNFITSTDLATVILFSQAFRCCNHFWLYFFPPERSLQSRFQTRNHDRNSTKERWQQILHCNRGSFNDLNSLGSFSTNYHLTVPERNDSVNSPTIVNNTIPSMVEHFALMSSMTDDMPSNSIFQHIFQSFQLLVDPNQRNFKKIAYGLRDIS